MHSSLAALFLSDPTDHGSNVGAVALFAMGIFVLIGLLVFLITRRGRRPRQRPKATSQESEGPGSEGRDRAEQHSASADAKAP